MGTDDEVRDKEKLFTAWLQTALEYDKSLLVVASAGLGLIASLADKVAILGGYASHAAVIAAVAFSAVVTNVLLAFRINRSYLVDLAEGNDGEKRKRWLKRLDTLGLLLFAIGIVSTLASTFGLLNSDKAEKMNKDELAKELAQKAERGEIQVGMENLCDIKSFLSSRSVNETASPTNPSGGKNASTAAPQKGQLTQDKTATKSEKPGPKG